MKRNVPYIKIAVCTQEPHIGKQIREYAAGFEIRGNVEIEVEVMKNCYPLAKKILRREYYDIICLGRKLWDIDSYTLASSIRTTDRETIFFLLGWNRTRHRTSHRYRSFICHCRKMNSEKNSTARSAIWDRGAAIFLLPYRRRKDVFCIVISNIFEKVAVPWSLIP